MQSTKHKSYTAQFTRSTVKSACSAEIKKLGDVLHGYWNTGEVQSLVYIIDNSLAPKCYINGNIWMSIVSTMPFSFALINSF